MRHAGAIPAKAGQGAQRWDKLRRSSQTHKRGTTVLTRLRRIRPLGFILGFVAAIVLTGGGVAAYAANGGSLLIGRSNTGTAVTTLTNSAGTPLSLRAKSSAYPPFAVNSSKKVPNLNADWLDGIDGANLVQRTGPYSATTGNIFGTSDWAPTDPTDPTSPPDETTNLIISIATCPTGTKLTGGGVDNFTATGFTLVDSPDANSWVVYVQVEDVPTHQADDTPANVTAYAVCYNPRGLVAGGQPNAVAAKSVSTLSPAMKSKLTRSMARSAK